MAIDLGPLASASSLIDVVRSPNGWPSLTGQLDRTRYRLQQQGLALSLGLGGRLISLILSPGRRAPGRELVAELERRYRALLDRDLENVAKGHYPRELLYQFPLREYVTVLPEFLLGLPAVLWRSYRGEYDDLPRDIDKNHYPPYYRRTFHWQTDGWLSSRSARLYDASVEVLFGGTADVMRRMTIPPLVESVRDRAKPRILDVACGTGRFLLQLHRALPRAKLYGLDLSPYYVKKAAEVLHPATDVSLVSDNAESMPFADGFFDAVTSVFLFHELPGRVRRTVMREAWRVLKPGGCFAVCDSVQLSDSAMLKTVLEGFPAAYHEPYYKSYMRDDLARVMSECGFAVESSETHLVSKVVAGRKA
jgi:ubiquinone/menaquinone biosynthesis C-methylase UbiE